jgi:hypothetical protein
VSLYYSGHYQKDIAIIVRNRAGCGNVYRYGIEFQINNFTPKTQRIISQIIETEKSRKNTSSLLIRSQ